MSGINSEVRYLAVRATNSFDYKETFWKQTELWVFLWVLQGRIDASDEWDL